MNCIIIDDEPLARGIIERYVLQVPFLNLIGQASNALEAMNLLNQETSIDLLFLDIQMPGISGVDFAKSLEKKPMIVFTTAYEQYALDGFQINALDYLMKPVSFPQFLRSVNRASEAYNHKKNPVRSQSEIIEKEQDFIFIRCESSDVKVRISDISRIESLKDYVKIFLNDKFLLSLTSLKVMEEKLMNNQFVRVHRSHLISIPHIENIYKNRVKIDGTVLPIGESYKNSFLKSIERFR